MIILDICNINHRQNMISLINKYLLKFKERATPQKTEKYSQQSIIDKAKLYKDNLIV